MVASILRDRALYSASFSSHPRSCCSGQRDRPSPRDALRTGVLLDPIRDGEQALGLRYVQATETGDVNPMAELDARLGSRAGLELTMVGFPIHCGGQWRGRCRKKRRRWGG